MSPDYTGFHVCQCKEQDSEDALGTGSPKLVKLGKDQVMTFQPLYI